MKTPIAQLLIFAFSFLAAAARADGPTPPPQENWDVDGDLYIGAMVPYGTETKAGVAMGGKVSTRYESTNRKVLLYGELMGEGFNNGANSQDIKFSQFYLNTGLMVGAKSVKWKTPANINLSRDLVTNESFTVRYAFSGLYVRMLDETAEEGKLHQILETMADFVYARINYDQGWQVPYTPCTPPSPCQPPAQTLPSGRNVLGLYAALKYEIEKNGWGSIMQVELLQDLSPSYSKVTGKIIAYKQLKGDLKYLRPYVELDGVLDHDAVDPSGSLQGAIRVFGGISGRFGI